VRKFQLTDLLQQIRTSKLNNALFQLLQSSAWLDKRHRITLVGIVVGPTDPTHPTPAPSSPPLPRRIRPNAPWRDQVTALVKDSDGVSDTLSGVSVINEPSETRCPQPVYLWAMLIARIYEVFPLECPTCGHPMRIIAFVTEAASIVKILSHIDEPTPPPEISPARAPPQRDESEINQDIYEYNFDQSISW
jgi:hypothetical protein